MRKLIFVLLAGALLAGCVSEKQTDRSTAHLPLGTPMPQFYVTGPSGTVSTETTAGRKTLVVMFRWDCPDCQRELPKIEAAYKALGGESANTDFVAISKDDPQAVAAYWSQRGYTIPYYFDTYGAAFSNFGVKYVPTLHLFGSDGKVAFAAVETFDFDANELVNQITQLR